MAKELAQKKRHLSRSTTINNFHSQKLITPTKRVENKRTLHSSTTGPIKTIDRFLITIFTSKPLRHPIWPCQLKRLPSHAPNQTTHLIRIKMVDLGKYWGKSRNFRKIKAKVVKISPKTHKRKVMVEVDKAQIERKMKLRTKSEIWFKTQREASFLLVLTCHNSTPTSTISSRL